MQTTAKVSRLSINITKIIRIKDTNENNLPIGQFSKIAYEITHGIALQSVSVSLIEEEV